MNWSVSLSVCNSVVEWIDWVLYLEWEYLSEYKYVLVKEIIGDGIVVDIFGKEWEGIWVEREVVLERGMDEDGDVVENVVSKRIIGVLDWVSEETCRALLESEEVAASVFEFGHIICERTIIVHVLQS